MTLVPYRNRKFIAQSKQNQQKVQSIDTNLALKANQADVTSSLALKANQADVTSSLALKANQADVTSSLALKAEKNGDANEQFECIQLTLSNQNTGHDSLRFRHFTPSEVGQSGSAEQTTLASSLALTNNSGTAFGQLMVQDVRLGNGDSVTETLTALDTAIDNNEAAIAAINTGTAASTMFLGQTDAVQGGLLKQEFLDVTSSLALKAEINGSINEAFNTNALRVHSSSAVVLQAAVDVSALVTTTDPGDPQNPTNATSSVIFSNANLAGSEAALIAKDIFLTNTGTPSSLVRKLDQLTPEATIGGVGQTAPVQGNVLNDRFNGLDAQVAGRALVINPTFTNNITVDNKLKVSDFAKIQLQDGSQHIGEFIDNKVNNAPAPSATQPSMTLTKLGGYTINWKPMNIIDQSISGGYSGTRGVSPGDLFGISCALSADGSRLVVGASHRDEAVANGGEVRVYEWNGSSWSQMGADLNGSANSYFGYSVAMSADGSRIAVGAWGAPHRGIAAVYQWTGASWFQIGSNIIGEVAGDSFGFSVDMSADGERVAIGAIFNDGNSSNSGHARVYYDNGGSWVQLGQDIDGAAAGDEFGLGVAMSADGRRVAVVAPKNDDNGVDSGHCRVFQYDAGTTAWVQLGLDIDGEAANDMTRRVALSADGLIVAVTAIHNDGGANNAGHARVFQYDGVNWVKLGQDIDGVAAGDFVDAVALSADGLRLAVGAYGADRGATDNGHVRTYQWNPTLYVWESIGQELYAAANNLLLSGNGALAFSADGSRLVVGAYGFASSRGMVYTYDYLRNNTYTVTQATYPNGNDITNAPIDLAYLTNTTVAIVDAAGNSVSNISSAGTYTVTYTSTNMKNESNQLSLTVSL